MRFAFAFVALVSAIGAGCTLLVSFDDPLPPLDDAAPPPPDVAPPPDARALFDPDASAACLGLKDGHYCGNNQLDAYPFRDDLVACEAGRIVDTTICPDLCIHLKNPHPDQCDPCLGRQDGYYCGDQFPGWLPENANVLVHCQSNVHDREDTLCTSCTPGKDTCPH